MAICPECEYDELTTEGLEDGEELTCPECGQLLMVAGDDDLQIAGDDDLDDDDDDEEEEDDEDGLGLDEDENEGEDDDD
jgi:hypothetical protein